MNESDKGPRFGRRALLRGALAGAAVAALSKLLPKSEEKSSSAQAAGNFKIYMPRSDQRFADPTPVPETAFDKLRQQTNPPIESVSGVNAGVTVLTESRATSDALYKIDFNDSVKQTMADSIAFDGRGRGYNTADIIIVKSRDQVPTDVINLTDFNINEIGIVGQIGSIKINSRVYLFFIPKSDLNIDNPDRLFKINWNLADSFFRTTASGGDMSANNQVGRPDYANLKSSNALMLIKS